jgi:UDP-glucuronate 4-epimerase
MRVLVTGSAGFIGFHLAKRLLADGHEVFGYDGMTTYYDIKLKERRVSLLKDFASYTHKVGQLEDLASLLAFGEIAQPDIVVHLAAQAGVRYSLEYPEAYVSSNLVGTFNVMELARQLKPAHLMLASTSSVYGGNDVMPFREVDRADFPITLYAATKKANEEMSHSYAHLWKLPTTCFRFFTVYGPWGRPDMALFKFVKAMQEDAPIDIYGGGNMQRDFTYVDDLVEGIVRLMSKAPTVDDEKLPVGPFDSLSPVAPWRVVNIAGGSPVGLMDFIAAIERHLGKEAKKNLMPMQKGDVPATFADATLLKALTGYTPETPVDEGVKRFVEWYKTEWQS